MDHQLVLVGKTTRNSGKLYSLVEALHIAERVCFTGYISDESLVQLYNQADIFVYPSKYEGFGLPLLEAMACGTPVVTSRRSALSEVVGNGAVLVDPYSDADLAGGIERVLLDEEFRSSLISLGIDRVSHFSWKKMTEKICKFMGLDEEIAS